MLLVYQSYLNIQCILGWLKNIHMHFSFFIASDVQII